MGALEALTALRSETYQVDDLEVELRELTAEQAAEMWGALEAAEQAGKLHDIYRYMLLYCTYHEGKPVFLSLEDVSRVPARHLVPMGERLLALCEMDIDLGNPPGPAESCID